MKALHEEVSLRGKIENITMSELRARPGEVLQSVELGKVFVVTRNGKQVAVLAPVPGEELVTIIQPDGSKSYGIAV
jgi:prevent-host-death family protein